MTRKFIFVAVISLLSTPIAQAKGWYILDFGKAECRRPDVLSNTPANLVKSLRKSGIVPEVKLIHAYDGSKVVEIKNMLHGEPVAMFYFTSIKMCNKLLKHFEDNGKIVPDNKLN